MTPSILVYIRIEIFKLVYGINLYLQTRTIVCMPRVTPQQLKEAFRQNPLLVRLIRATRTLDGAKRELRWIQNELPESRWEDAIIRRSRLEPLQYILGTQPFGGLDVICRKGALIPRWETEEWAERLCDVLIKYHEAKSIKILEACIGTGCISLLLHKRLKACEKDVQVCGFDISQAALSVARDNLSFYRDTTNHYDESIRFEEADVSKKETIEGLEFVPADILVANPPYIPLEDYHKREGSNGVELSVRLYEPKKALVGDLEFYNNLIENALLPMGMKGFVFELGYQKQIDFVVNRIRKDKGEKWGFGGLTDGANNLRCVFGWEYDSPMSILSYLHNGECAFRV